MIVMNEMLPQDVKTSTDLNANVTHIENHTL